MKNLVLQQIVYPTVRRLGTIVATAAVTAMAVTDQELIRAFEAVSVAVLFYGTDLINSWLERR